MDVHQTRRKSSLTLINKSQCSYGVVQEMSNCSVRRKREDVDWPREIGATFKEFTTGFYTLAL